MRGLDIFRVIYRNWRGLNIEFYMCSRGTIREVFEKKMIDIVLEAGFFDFYVKCTVEAYTSKKTYYGVKAYEIFEKYERGELKDEEFHAICLRCENSEGGIVWVCYPP